MEIKNHKGGKLRLTIFPRLWWTKCDVCKRSFRYTKMYVTGYRYDVDEFVCLLCAKTGEEAYDKLFGYNKNSIMIF